MRKKEIESIFMVVPILMSVISAYHELWELMLIVIFLIYVLVAILPCCRKRENLWIFVLTAVCSVPINGFLLSYFDGYMQYLCCVNEGILSVIERLEYILILMGVEQVVFGLAARIIWPKQYKLYIPVSEEE